MKTPSFFEIHCDSLMTCPLCGFKTLNIQVWSDNNDTLATMNCKLCGLTSTDLYAKTEVFLKVM